MHEPPSARSRSLLRDHPAKSRHWLAWLLVLVVCGVLLLPLLHKTPAAATQSGGGRGGRGGDGTAVTVAQVQTGQMQIFLDAMGTVTPQATVNVYSQVSGRVVSVNYREGQMVRKGQVLAEIDPRPTEAQLQQAQAARARDQATLQQAKADLQRYQEALEDHAIAEQTVADQKATVAQDEGTVANDQASVDYSQVQLGYCHILAPIAGQIGLRLIDAGNTVFSGSGTTIATITQVDPITVVFSVAEDNLPQIREQIGARKTLDVDLYDRAQTTKIASGRLLSLDNQVDTTTGTVKLRALFDNPKGALFANQFVNARLQVNTLQNAKLIPTVAIQYNGQQAFVYQVQPDKTAHLHNITVTHSEGEQSAIDGLNPGDTVVSSNFDRLEDGATISIAAPGRGAAPAGQGSTPRSGTRQGPPADGQRGGRPANAGPGR
ncbi:MAG TPA: efflux RND transporter periplasmic adaptor subunit [Vicinamibacterales bacterium]